MQRTPTILSASIVIVYLVLAVVQLGESFVMDEMEFPRLAEAVAETGRPVYYRGEQSPAHVGVFHPPLYGYTLGGWIALFGFSEVAIRLFGVLLMIGTAWIGVRTVKLLQLAGRWGPPLFLALFLLHPYVIQSALLPDIDGTVLLFATVLLFHEVTRVALHQVTLGNSVVRVGLALALALAAKLTSVILIPAVFVGLLLGRGLKRSALLTGLATAFGVSVFLVTWWVVSTVADLPFAFPFEFTIQSGLKGGVGETGVGDLLARLVPAPWTIYWLGVLLPTLAILGTGFVIARWNTNPERRFVLMFSVWTFGAIAFFSVISGPPFGFPKYFIAALPTMAIVGLVPADAALERASFRASSRWLGAAPLLALIVLSVWSHSRVADDSPYSWPGYWWTIGVVVLSALALSLLIRHRDAWLVSVAAGALLAATLSYNLGMASVQAGDERSVRYFPGETGLDDTIERLQEIADPDEPILAPKDVGSAAFNRYHEQEQLFLDLERLDDVLRDDDLEYVVVRTGGDYSYLIFPEVEPIIEEEMDLLEQIGGFLIYERAGDD